MAFKGSHTHVIDGKAPLTRDYCVSQTYFAARFYKKDLDIRKIYYKLEG